MRKGVIAGVMAVAMAWSAPVLASPSDWLRLGYQALDEEGRKTVQEEMRLTGLYDGQVDGIYGEETAKALEAVPLFLRTETVDKIEVPLDTPEDGVRFVREIAQRAWSGFLYEGAAENPSHAR